MKCLNLRAPNKLAQITVLEAIKMKQKPSLTDWVHKNGAPAKNVKRCQQPTSLECICCHEIPAVKAFHLKFKARRTSNTAINWKLGFFAVEFNCVGNLSWKSFSQKFLRNYFLVLVSTFSKWLLFRYFAVTLFLLR